MKILYPKDYSFVEIGKQVCVEWENKVVEIIEILGDNIITNRGIYQKEQLSSLLETVMKLRYFDIHSN